MFNSFIPASVSDDLANRLVEHYLNRLEEDPHLHDKVEFEIAYTCLTFDFDRQAESLVASGFSDGDIVELRGALRSITVSAASRRENDDSLLRMLAQRYSQILGSDAAPVDRAFLLLEDCKRFGTLPFAHMARTGFVAVALLRSLEAIGVTTPEQTAEFMESVPTVASGLDQDADSVRTGDMEWDAFVGRYGHLRPGTYDVTIDRYDADPERYLRPLVSLTAPDRPDGGATGKSDYWDSTTRQAVSEAIYDLGFDWTIEQFEGFVRQAIQDREYAKFLFSKNLSQALEELVVFSEQQGITRDDLSHLDLKDIASVRNGEVISEQDWLLRRIDAGRRSQESSLRVELPPLIFSESEIDMFESWEQEPNFVTSKRVQARIVEFGDTVVSGDELEGRIVLIPNADPGYDWLLARPIAGLITMYGGANSHMSIRAAELSLPAAIGVGERVYATLSPAIEIELDCESRRIGIIR
jgi:hypothetical protein